MLQTSSIPGHRRHTVDAGRDLRAPAPARHNRRIGDGHDESRIFGVWGVSAWVPALIQNRIAADPSVASGSNANSYVSYAIMILTLGSLPGYALVAALADRWGRKPAFAFFFVGGALSAPFIFLIPWTLTQMLFLLPVLVFTLGISGVFHLPAGVVPTRLRTTGAVFCFKSSA